MTSDFKQCKGIIAVLDILGFSEKIKLLTNQENLNEIENITSSLKEIELKFSNKAHGIACSIISDTIVISTKDHSADGYVSIFTSIARLAHELFNHGLIFRGYVTHGIFCHNEQESVIVGDAFISAYKAEQERCIFSIVLVNINDNEIDRPSSLSGNVFAYDEALISPNDFLVTERDGEKALNLLGTMYHFSNFFNNFNGIQILKKIISEGLKSENEKIRAKYIWLGNDLKQFIQSAYPDNAFELTIGLD